MVRIAYTSGMIVSFASRLSALQRSMVSAVAGFLFYGGWAFLVNSMHGAVAALKASCVQGAYSFVLTFCMTIMLEWLYRVVSRLTDIDFVINWVTIIACCLIIFSTSWWVNAMAGTPEIFNTVILGYVIGAIYSTTYVYGLSRAQAIKPEVPRFN